jgi:cardiolipin synthase
VKTGDNLVAALLGCVHGLPPGHVRALIAALETATAAEARATVLGAMPTPAYRQHATALLDAWSQSAGCTGPALAVALKTALAVAEHERDAEKVDLVATGPSSPHVSIRHTKAVLLELIDRARHELIVVSYAAYKVPALVSALQSARQRSVLVRLILESTADSAGALTHDGAAAFESLRESVELYVWPIEKRPAGSRLHAKVAVADGETAFVTSANLTGHALDQNLEVGVLISGGQTPRRLMDHFHALIAKGTLARL